MSQRLIDLRTIRAEKICRSRAWIYAQIAAGNFPKPLPLQGSNKNLWRETDIDSWLLDFVARAETAAQGDSKSRAAKAGQVRAAKRTQMAIAA